MHKKGVILRALLSAMLLFATSNEIEAQNKGERDMSRTEVCKRNFRTLFKGANFAEIHFWRSFRNRKFRYQNKGDADSSIIEHSADFTSA